MMWIRFRWIARFLVPAILLFVIFGKINLKELIVALSNVNPWLYFMGMVVGYFSQVFLAAWRWKFILNSFYQIQIPYYILLRYLWIGMFLGYFVPSGIGTDVYRVAKAAKYKGGYKVNIIAIIGEKGFILLGSTLLIMMGYPMINRMIVLDTGITEVVNSIYLVAAVALMVLISLIVAFALGRPMSNQRICDWLQKKLDSVKHIISTKVGGRFVEGSDGLSISDLIRPFFRWQNIFVMVTFTIGMRIISAAGGNIIFMALKTDVPIIVNIFVATLMFIIFMVPISFGTLGIREGSFIVLYGMFGISSETALAASFLGLASLLSMTSVGGIILLVRNIRQKTD